LNETGLEILHANLGSLDKYESLLQSVKNSLRMHLPVMIVAVFVILLSDVLLSVLNGSYNFNLKPEMVHVLGQFILQHIELVMGLSKLTDVCVTFI
jgi:hypothetical protein